MIHHDYYMFLNGIRTESNDLNSWHFRACDYVENETDHQASTYHYEVKALTKAFLQGRHVDRLGLRLQHFASIRGRRMVVTGHSNGCDLLALALQKYTHICLDTVNFIAGAANASMNKNGLNAALLEGRVRQVNVWYDKADPALRAAKWFGGVLGYGHIGLEGPVDVDPRVRSRVGLIESPGMGHSNYFTPGAKFEATMQGVLTF